MKNYWKIQLDNPYSNITQKLMPCNDYDIEETPHYVYPW